MQVGNLIQYIIKRFFFIASARYFFTVLHAAGLPTPRRGCQSEPLPCVAKMECNFPIKASTVPNARCLGQLQECCKLGVCTNHTQSHNHADERAFYHYGPSIPEKLSLGDDKLDRKLASSLSKEFFCLEQLEEDCCFDNRCKRLPIIPQSISSL